MTVNQRNNSLWNKVLERRQTPSKRGNLLAAHISAPFTVTQEDITLHNHMLFFSDMNLPGDFGGTSALHSALFLNAHIKSVI